MFKKSRTGRWEDATVLGFFQGAHALTKQATEAMNALPPVFAPVYERFEARVGELDDLYKSGGASPITEQLRREDAGRDGAYTGLRYLVKSYTYHEDEDIAHGATLVETGMKLYGPDLTIQSYMNETVGIASFLRDLTEKPELAAAVALIPGFDNFRIPLTRHNTNFHTLYLKRVEEKASEPGFNAADKQKEVIAAYELLLEKINGFVSVSETPAPWMELKRKLETLWEQYDYTEAVRLGRAAAHKAATPPASA